MSANRKIDFFFRFFLLNKSVEPFAYLTLIVYQDRISKISNLTCLAVAVRTDTTKFMG